jgi:hypothetical protein
MLPVLKPKIGSTRARCRDLVRFDLGRLAFLGPAGIQVFVSQAFRIFLTDALHIKPETADTAMKIILAYLLIGSYGSLFWLWRQRRRAAALV